MQHKIDVLDNGFIEFLDSMGNDLTPARDARISTGSEAKSDSSDATLIRFLLRHHHTTPFEGVVLKLKVKAPIMVFREWHRHRTMCLSGDNFLYFNLPYKNGKNKAPFKIKISDFYDKWTNGAKPVPIKKKKIADISKIDEEKIYTKDELCEIAGIKRQSLNALILKGKLKVKNKRKINNKIEYDILGQDWINCTRDTHNLRIPLKQRLQTMLLRSCDEVTKEIYTTSVKNIWQSGTKEVYELELENGYKIKCSKDHLFFTNDGWKTLELAVELKKNKENNVSWRNNSIEFCVNGKNKSYLDELYKIKEWLEIHKSYGISISEMATLANTTSYTILYWFKKYKLCYTSEEKGLMLSRKITGKRWKISSYNLSEKGKANITKSRSGKNSNWWKGGISKRKTTYKPQEIYKRDNYKCIICSSNVKLRAHHVDPIWNNPDKVNDKNNLVTLCIECHKKLHNLNLELEFLKIFEIGKKYPKFFENFNVKLERQYNRNIKRKQYNLIADFSKVKNIKYVGEEMTYDLEVDGPFNNFVCNGLIVHNSYNEESSRYKQLEPNYYIPEVSRVQKQSANNKQGSGDIFEQEAALRVRTGWEKEQFQFEESYQSLIDSEMAKELCRLNMPISHYSTMIVTANLLNWFRFLQLRMAPTAQFEIRQYANAIGEIIKEKFPICWSAFEDYWLNTITFSAKEIEILKELSSFNSNTWETIVESKKEELPIKGRELQEFKDKLKKLQ